MNPTESAARCREICLMAPVIPVIVIEDASRARPLAETLVGAGLPVLEVTLRTPAALEALAAMAAVPGGVAGAGTLITPRDVAAARDAGARFGVSPGSTDRLLDACMDAGLPILAGAATASESMRLLEAGHSVQKFFPADAAGGAAALAALAAPLPQVSFCPTGGIRADSAAGYLALPNVLCVGGAWVVPPKLIAVGDWDGIAALARAAAALSRRAKAG